MCHAIRVGSHVFGGGARSTLKHLLDAMVFVMFVDRACEMARSPRPHRHRAVACEQLAETPLRICALGAVSLLGVGMSAGWVDPLLQSRAGAFSSPIPPAHSWGGIRYPAALGRFFFVVVAQ